MTTVGNISTPAWKGTKLLRKTPRFDSDTINLLDNIEFSGPITVIEDEDSFAYAISRLQCSQIIGFDTESRPAFLKGQKFPVSLIQISLLDEAFIFRLKSIGLRDELIEIFTNNNIIKVGVGVKDDIRRLQEMKNFEASGFLDLSDIARKKGIIQCGARALTAMYLHKRLVKSSQKTNWAKKNLTERQLRYAATDAWVCLQILPLILSDNYTYADEPEKAEAVGDE